NSPEASRPVLEEELVHTQRELESLVHSTEGQVNFSREPGTGRLIENRVVTVPAAGPTRADWVRARLDTAGRFLGAVMVYQTVRDEEHLAQQVQSGQATVPQAVIGTVRNIQGITIGLRMMTAIEVHPGEFIVMSVLDFSQAVAGNYNSTEERAVAI